MAGVFVRCDWTSCKHVPDIVTGKTPDLRVFASFKKSKGILLDLLKKLFCINVSTKLMHICIWQKIYCGFIRVMLFITDNFFRIRLSFPTNWNFLPSVWNPSPVFWKSVANETQEYYTERKWYARNVCEKLMKVWTSAKKWYLCLLETEDFNTTCSVRVTVCPYKFVRKAQNFKIVSIERASMYSSSFVSKVLLVLNWKQIYFKCIW